MSVVAALSAMTFAGCASTFQGIGGDIATGATAELAAEGATDSVMASIATSLREALDREIDPFLDETLKDAELSVEELLDRLEADVSEWAEPFVREQLAKDLRAMLREELDEVGALSRAELAALEPVLQEVIRSALVDVEPLIRNLADAAVQEGAARLDTELQTGALRATLIELAEELATRGVEAADRSARDSGILEDARLLITLAIVALLLVALILLLRRTQRERRLSRDRLRSLARPVRELATPELMEAIEARANLFGVGDWLESFLTGDDDEQDEKEKAEGKAEGKKKPE